MSKLWMCSVHMHIENVWCVNFIWQWSLPTRRSTTQIAVNTQLLNIFCFTYSVLLVDPRKRNRYFAFRWQNWVCVKINEIPGMWFFELLLFYLFLLIHCHKSRQMIKIKYYIVFCWSHKLQFDSLELICFMVKLQTGCVLLNFPNTCVACARLDWSISEIRFNFNAFMVTKTV